MESNSSFMFTSVVMTILYAALFVLSVILARKRAEKGFQVLQIATGIWLVNMIFYWTSVVFLLRLTTYLFPIGLLFAVIALSLLVSGRGNSVK